MVVSLILLFSRSNLPSECIPTLFTCGLSRAHSCAISSTHGCGQSCAMRFAAFPICRRLKGELSRHMAVVEGQVSTSGREASGPSIGSSHRKGVGGSWTPSMSRMIQSRGVRPCTRSIQPPSRFIEAPGCRRSPATRCQSARSGCWTQSSAPAPHDQRLPASWITEAAPARRH